MRDCFALMHVCVPHACMVLTEEPCKLMQDNHEFSQGHSS